MANEKLPRRKVKLQNAYPQTAKFLPLLLVSAISSELLRTTATLITRLNIPGIISKSIFRPIRSVITKFSVQGGVSFPSDKNVAATISNPKLRCKTILKLYGHLMMKKSK